MHTVQTESLWKTHYCSLLKLKEHGDIIQSPAWDTARKEIQLTAITENPLHNLKIPLCIPCGAKELRNYIDEICEGTLDHLIDEGKLPYTYSERYNAADQLHHVIELLKKDPNTTRAVITIRKPTDCLIENQPCLTFIQFLIRHAQLQMYVFFRSNDAVKASPLNDLALCALGAKVGSQIGKELSLYSKTAVSYHAYRQDFALLAAICKRFEEYRYFASDKLYVSEDNFFSGLFE